MRFRLVLLLGFCFAFAIAAMAKDPSNSTKHLRLVAVAAPAVTDRLPVRHVALYKNGVGYFQHDGQVHGSQTVTIAFTTAQLNDVLKSLTAIDLNGGRITDVSYNSTAPLDQRLNALQIPIGERTTTAEFLDALRGARVAVRNGATAAVGRLLSVEAIAVPSKSSDDEDGKDRKPTSHTEVSVVTDAGELRTFRLTPATSVHLLEHDVNQEIGRYLSLISSTRAADVRKMTIATEGAGDRELMVSYISEVPVWKSTYRIVLSSKPDQKPLLQGWAVVDNTVGEDWDNVELSLIAGAPQSFVQDISRPYYARRPIVGPPQLAMLTPQTHESALSEYEQRGLASKDDRLEQVAPLSGATNRGNESVKAEASPVRPATGGPTLKLNGAIGFGYGGGGYKPGMDQAQQTPTAAAQEIGDLFEYKIKQPITIHKNQSALVPILQARVDAEKVTLWSASEPHPLHALWLTNSSGLTLDGGSFSIQEANTFAGEGLMDAIRPGEKRLISYAADPAVQIKSDAKGEGQRVTLVRIHRGVMFHETQSREHYTYTVRNQDAEPRCVVIEHPQRQGWELAGGAKPEETSTSAYRFRVNVEPAKTASLEFDEVHSYGTNYSLSNLTPDQIAVFVHQGWMKESVEAALHPIMEQKDKIAELAGKLTSLNGTISAIFDDQKRLRDNLSALKGGADEHVLAQRYTSELNRQEDELAGLRKDLAATQSKYDAANQRLNDLMEKLEMEVKL